MIKLMFLHSSYKQWIGRKYSYIDKNDVFNIQIQSVEKCSQEWISEQTKHRNNSFYEKIFSTSSEHKLNWTCQFEWNEYDSSDRNGNCLSRWRKNVRQIFNLFVIKVEFCRIIASSVTDDSSIFIDWLLINVILM